MATAICSVRHWSRSSPRGSPSHRSSSMGAAIGLETEAASTLGEAKPTGSEAVNGGAGGQRGLQRDLGFRPRARPRLRRGHRHHSPVRVAEHHRPQPEDAREIAEHPIQRGTAAYLVHQMTEQGDLLVRPARRPGPACAPRAEGRRDEAARGEGHEGDEVVGLADRQGEVGLGEEEVQAHGRHQRRHQRGNRPAELGDDDGEGQEDESQVRGGCHFAQRDQGHADCHRAQRGPKGPTATAPICHRLTRLMSRLPVRAQPISASGRVRPGAFAERHHRVRLEASYRLDRVRPTVIATARRTLRR